MGLVYRPVADRRNDARKVNIRASRATQVKPQPDITLAEPPQPVDADDDFKEIMAGRQKATRYLQN